MEDFCTVPWYSFSGQANGNYIEIYNNTLSCFLPVLNPPTILHGRTCTNSLATREALNFTMFFWIVEKQGHATPPIPDGQGGIQCKLQNA
eukprot:2180067-Ditylum_brightwellii.AAC.1